MFLLYHSDGCNTSEMVFHWCYVNDLHTTHVVVCWVTAIHHEINSQGVYIYTFLGQTRGDGMKIEANECRGGAKSLHHAAWALDYGGGRPICSSLTSCFSTLYCCMCIERESCSQTLPFLDPPKLPENQKYYNIMFFSHPLSNTK
jgi:hypothetical protein